MLDAQSGRFESEQIGSFFAFYRVVDAEGVVSLIGEARIPKRQPELCETLCRLYHAGALNFSFEISVALLKEQDGVRVIDAAEGNELIGMAVVTHPACPEATALRLVAEEQNDSGRDETDMDEKEKRIAELESKLQKAEQKSECDEELRKKDEELEEAEKKRSRCEAELAECRAQLAERNERIAGLETQVAELTPFKAEAEQLRAEKAAAELAARQQELTRFAETQGLDLKADVSAEAIRKADYATLVAEVVKAEKPAVRPVVASYAMGGGIAARGEYDDLLGKA